MVVRPYVECTREEESLRNTGAFEQCLEGVTIRYALAANDQEFADIAALKSLAAWNAAIADKKIIPLYPIEELAAADTEDTNWEGNSVYLTKTGKKIRTHSEMLGLCSHAALASYNNKVMRVYEFTDEQEIVAVRAGDGVKVKGQSVKITVGKRMDAMPDKPAFTPVTLEFQDHKEKELAGVVVKTSWSNLDIRGIFDVYIDQVSASATSIKFTVDAGCAGEAVTSLEDADFVVLDADGEALDHSFVPADSDGVYEITGTGFTSGITIDLDGVVTKVEIHYEAVEPLTVTIGS